MRKTMVYLTETQRAALERQARRRRVGMARLIREAIDRYLTAQAPPRPRFIASLDDPQPGPVSERVEALLAEHLRRASPR
jgi:hypothetical protein